MDPWEEVDATSWPVAYQEPRGNRIKFWVQAPDGTLWLRKEPRASRPAELTIEALVLRLAREVGVDACQSLACTWTTGSSDHRRGILVKIFLEGDEELSSGMVELATDASYDPEQRRLHTLSRVRSALERLTALAARPLLEPFVRMLAFDAWVGNSDRHQENWGVLRIASKPRRLAPMFDPAACLGAELAEG